MVNILVTGGAGFIGANFVQYMVDRYPDYKIVNLDKLTYSGNLETCKAIEKKRNYQFIKGDIVDREFIFSLFEKEQFDMVVNFAAESHVDRSIEHPDIFMKTNVLGTTTLLDASVAYHVQRFHQVSTDEVYGDLPLHLPDLKFQESTALAPSSPYSSSKASADLMVLAYYKTYGLPVTISRCSNNYGPYQFPEKLIPLTILRAIDHKKIPVYGTGENIRDWLHVKDHCVAIDQILHFGQVPEVYNIGGNEEICNVDVVRSILEIFDISDELIEYVKDRPGHDLRYAIDSSKLQRELGWRPTYTFQEGIKETVAWYQNNREWWKHIQTGEYLAYIKEHYGVSDE